MFITPHTCHWNTWELAEVLAELPMLYDKILSIKPVNHPSPPCKDCSKFSHHLPFQFIKALWKRDGTSSLSGWSPCFLLQCLPHAFNKPHCHFSLYFQVLPEFSHGRQMPKTLLAKVFKDHPLVARDKVCYKFKEVGVGRLHWENGTLMQKLMGSHWLSKEKGGAR
jgi:hypothetical protein